MDDIALLLGFNFIHCRYLMSDPSAWPLSEEAFRILVPDAMLLMLEQHVLSRDCFPTALGYYPRAYDHQMGRIGHDDFIMIYCASGAGELVTDSYQGQVVSGDLIVLPPGSKHRYASQDNSPWTLFWCHFRGALAGDFYRQLPLRPGCPIIHGSNDLTLQSSFSSLIRTVRKAYSVSDYIHVANHLRHTLALIEPIYRQVNNSPIRTILTEASVSELREYMRDNLHKQLSLDDLAKVSKLSKYHFNRKYKALTGHSPLQHFIELKIEQACFLLESSHLRIADIAFQLGYDDPLYFSRVFRKVMAVSPSQYRKALH